MICICSDSFQTTNSNSGNLSVLISQLWATKKNLGKRLEDIQPPSPDLKNILEEIHFKDDLTRSRCRGWLLLQSTRCMRADILCPGCDFDYRLTITAHNGMLQPRSQGLSSNRPLRRARRDPGLVWSRATLTIENIREGSSVVWQFVALIFVALRPTLTAMFNNSLRAD